MQSLAEQLRLTRLEADLRKWERAKFFTPYPKQRAFIAASRDTFELMMSGGNGVGKTELGAFIMACHLTGEYPEWWEGHRWEQPIEAWACGSAGDQIIKTVQLKLFGRLGEEYGTGMIPRRALIGEPVRSRHAVGLIASASVRHKSGGVSQISQMAYSQDVEDWQGPRTHFNWYDEEPPMEHYAEGEARHTGRNGRSMLTFTPMAGPTQVVKRFIDEESPLRARFEMSVDEADHILPEEKQRLWASYLPHQREARYHGRVMLGEGAVYTTPEEDLLVDLPLVDVPLHWFKGWGLDFGGAGHVAHPFAAVLMAEDRDVGEFYVLATVRMRESIALQHTDAMRRIAPGIPVAWPHDGHVVGDSGDDKVSLYKKHGLLMMQEHATLPQGGHSLYAALSEIDDLMKARRWKVRRELLDWRGEYRLYHYKDGKVVKLADDLMSATRIAYMMRRKWKAGPIGEDLFAARVKKRPIEAPRLDPWTGRPLYV